MSATKAVPGPGQEVWCREGCEQIIVATLKNRLSHLRLHHPHLLIHRDAVVCRISSALVASVTVVVFLSAVYSFLVVDAIQFHGYRLSPRIGLVVELRLGL